MGKHTVFGGHGFEFHHPELGALWTQVDVGIIISYDELQV